MEDLFDMVRRLRVRRNEIVELLNRIAPELIRELESIDTTVREIDLVLLKHGYPRSSPGLASSVVEPVPPKAGRVPLSQRREVLREYLRKRGRATRVQILEETGMPAGTLSALLQENGFTQVGHGLWSLSPASGPEHE